MLLDEIIAILTILLDIFGTIVVIYGALVAASAALRIESSKKNKFRQYSDAKSVFVQKLVFGLDFFIAGDIISTIAAPSQAQLVSLAVIVAIRTVLSYFLGKDEKRR